MPMDELLKKKPNENYYSYTWRIDKLIRDGLYKNWEEVVDDVNSQLHGDKVENYKGESAYRKDVASARRYYEAGVFDDSINENHIVKLKEEQEKLFKIKKQVGDRYREYRKLLTLDGRADNLEEKLLEVVSDLNKEMPLVFTPPVNNNVDKTAILVFSDWHYGLKTNNIWNTYNTEICRQRVKTCVEKAIEYIKLFNISHLIVCSTGDAYHGNIHVSCRVASEEETCDQLMHVAELMAQSIEELSWYVDNVDFYSCYGNHCRSIQIKQDSVHSDNFEKILPWWIKQRLQNNTKVTIHESEYREFTLFNVYGYNICAIHGDLDNIKDMATTFNTLFTRKFGKTIDYIISGDKHHLEEFEAFDIESIIVRSLCGTDDYANNKRLYSSAGQTLIIMSEEEGRECTRNIKV